MNITYSVQTNIVQVSVIRFARHSETDDEKETCATDLLGLQTIWVSRWVYRFRRI
jgi:hypothetical protein